MTAYILTGAGSAAETNATERETKGRESEPATATVIATASAWFGFRLEGVLSDLLIRPKTGDTSASASGRLWNSRRQKRRQNLRSVDVERNPDRGIGHAQQQRLQEQGEEEEEEEEEKEGARRGERQPCGGSWRW